MEFGPVRVAQKNSMYLSQILVIFSIARFWLNILYAKVSVRNIKDGIFRGNIFRKKKDRNSTEFCRNDWGKHFRDFLCNKQFYSSCLYGYGLIFVVSLLLRQMSCPCAATRTWSGGQFGAPVTLSMSVPGGSFQKGSQGWANPAASMAVDESWQPCGCWETFQHYVFAPWSHSVWGRSTCWTL